MDSQRLLFPRKSFSAHITNFPFNLFKDGWLHKMRTALLLLKWLERWCGQFYTMDVNTLQSEDCAKAGVINKKSLTRH